MSVQDETKARRISGWWRDASEAHIRSDLQRASNEASSLEDQRISLILNATWNKAVEKILPIHKAQVLSYMKLLDVPLGLLINFHEIKVTDGVNRLILPGANQ